MLDPELDRDVNVVGTRLLASRAREAGVRRFVFLSSGGAIYGEAAVPATECTLPAPRSYYGLHKFAAEELLRAEDLSCAVLRPSNVYGSRQRADADGGVVAIFLQHLLRGEPLDIFGSGHQHRDFVHISDVVTAVVAALGVDGDVLWNVASGEAVSVLGLAEAMAEIARLPAHLRFQPPRAGDVASSLLSCATLAATGLWGPPLSIASGLRLTLAQYIRDLFQQSQGAAAKAAR
jgi:UDP-glucose 4-epimerase